ncbi:zinc finger A20 and AN1 domain-containing stress-associated protein 1-like [Nymphaea colorata]|nr:zinc finger A20 and AN1 domain-containing stress-associated protein 1-like [Nymphaea colorata]
MAQESWKREKDETDCKIPEGLILCVNNCGLFGSPATLNMCSKCYNESLLKKPNPPPSSTSSSSAAAAPPPPSSPSPPLSSTSPSAPQTQTTPAPPQSSSSTASSSFSPSCPLPLPSQPSTSAIETPEKGIQKPDLTTEDRPVKTSSTVFRCASCQRKVGLTGFRCRCGDLFCARHRYSDTHDCSYDYKAAGREAIARENPVIKAAKIIKI